MNGEEEAGGGRSFDPVQEAQLDRITDAFPDRFLACEWVDDGLRVHVKDWTEGTAWDADGVHVRSCTRSMDELEAAQEAAEPLITALFAAESADHVRLVDHVGLALPRGVWRVQLRRPPGADEAPVVEQLTSTGAYEVVVVEDEWTEVRVS